MTRAEIFYLIPYFTSLVISITVLVYVWSRPVTVGVIPFKWYVLGQTLWIAGFIVDLAAKDVSGKIFWGGFQWFAVLVMLISLPVFAIQYTEEYPKYAKELFWLSLIVPALFALCLFLDQKFHWVYANPQLNSSNPLSGNPFDHLTYDLTFPVYGFGVYIYLIACYGLYVLLRYLARQHGLYQTQIALITLGFCVPILSSVFSALNISLAPERDVTPFAFAIGSLITTWSLFRFQVTDTNLVGRDRVFEAMVEPVVILDNQNRIMDINSSLLDLMGETAAKVIGKPAREVFDGFPIPIKQHIQTSYASAEASFTVGNRKAYYQLTVWPIYDLRKNITGRIFISHDITAFKELEQDLRTINAELESRVRARTRELAEAYDTTLEGWAHTLELRDKETEGHTRRVTDMTLKIAARMNINGEDLEHVRRGAILHDIGKMGIPDKILLKPGKFTKEERAIMEEHVDLAYRLLSPIPFLKKALDIPYGHHEKWDGSGYPRRLKGDEIPIAARIFAVVDVWDAIGSERPYKKAWSRKAAMDYFIKQSGKHFDPRVVNVFLDMLDKGEI